MTSDAAATLRLIDLGTVPSTNDEALRRAANGAPAWTVVRAVSQSAGRGRRGRAFASPPGNSYTSFIVRPDCPADTLPQIALVAGLAVAEALERVAPGLARPLCKWPNDILVAGRKVCGILVEAAAPGRGVVIGVGVNLVSHPDIPGEAIGDIVGLGGPRLDRDEWLDALAGRLRARLSEWRQGGFAAVRGALLDRMAGLGGEISVDGPPPLSGRLAGIDEDGALLVADRSGVARRCVSGSLVLEGRP